MALWAAVALGIMAVVSHDLFPEWVGELLPRPWSTIAVVFFPAFGAGITKAAFARNWNGSTAETPAPARRKRKAAA
jgi:hypothetical protein